VGKEASDDRYRDGLDRVRVGTSISPPSRLVLRRATSQYVANPSGPLLLRQNVVVRPITSMRRSSRPMQRIASMR